MKKRLYLLLCLLLSVCMAASCASEAVSVTSSEESFAESSESFESLESFETSETSDTSIDPVLPPLSERALRVVYLPMDNRPVNFQRVQYLAESVGIDLILPEESLFRTALDNMTPNPSGSTLGDREALLDFLKENEENADYFIISLDQILSGGLVGSRWYANTDLTFEYEVADYIIRLAKEHHVILFDTVMRLASTVNYRGMQLEEYNLLREYGASPRKTLSGDALTAENIVANYALSPAGQKIPVALPDATVERYLASRARKLRLADYILRNVAEYVDFCYIGVDDSHPGNSIQTNEIAYLNTLIPDGKGVIYAGTDEFGMMSVARVCAEEYGSAKVSVTYFGGGENEIADGFDYETLKQNTEKKLLSLGCTFSDDPDALRILVTTHTEDKRSAAQALLRQANADIASGRPVVICDPSGNKELRALLADGSFPMATLLGYSNWNTAGNALGLSLSMGVARYLYLKHGNVTEQSHEGFLKSLTFAFCKDIAYKTYGFGADRADSDQPYAYRYLLKIVNDGEIVVSLAPFATASHASVSVGAFRYPWERSFEMVFDVGVE